MLAACREPLGEQLPQSAMLPKTHRPAPWKNYTYRGRYLITATLQPGRRSLSRLSGDPRAPRLELTSLGLEVERQLRAIQEENPAIRLGPWIIMPDHFHVIAVVTQTLPRSIRLYFPRLFARVSQLNAGEIGLSEVDRLFQPGVNDRVIFDDRQFKAAGDYVLDNPRRLLIKRANPDLFRIRQHLVLGGVEMAAIGNIFLLRDFHRMPVIIHRAWPAAELEEHRHRWLECAENGGVLVSPFIHPEERRVRDEGLELGARIIRLQTEGFTERFKPSGREFALCAEGRLLLLSPWPDNDPRTKITRSAALTLNSFAERLCAASLPAALR